MNRCRAFRYEGHESWDCELTSLVGHRCILGVNHHGDHVMRCASPGGHSGDCKSGPTPLDMHSLCSLSRRSLGVFESNLRIVTNADNWPELDGQIPINWSAIVDAENDLVCVVPPRVIDHHDFSTRSEISLQTESKIRAQIICDILNMVQNDG